MENDKEIKKDYILMSRGYDKNDLDVIVESMRKVIKQVRKEKKEVCYLTE